MKSIVMLIGVAGFLWGCESGCASGEARCSGNAVQICNTQGAWEESMDCDALSQGSSIAFECGMDGDDEYSCLVVDGIDDAGDV